MSPRPTDNQILYAEILGNIWLSVSDKERKIMTQIWGSEMPNERYYEPKDLENAYEEMLTALDGAE